MTCPLRTAEALDPISTPQGRAEARDRRRAILREAARAARWLAWTSLGLLVIGLIGHVADKAIGQVIHDMHGREVSQWAN
ncbi:hypothetical protein [Rhodovulum sulfidophilum]|uniref:hypothetical protein n=1 Tax=Rhodovulum sulfidophilum TaxID=35806 RepID=UPI001F349EE9|nr:hypothetical protein [Rhodovulum sulfidophilum]MCE8438878.1 hypothetical protein [Rhodovulum sulfidophilum]